MVIALCQHNIDSTVQNFYNIFEVIDMAMKPGTKTITLRVSEEMYDKISDMARNEERSINNFIAYAVKKYIETNSRDVKK